MIDAPNRGRRRGRSLKWLLLAPLLIERRSGSDRRNAPCPACQGSTRQLCTTCGGVGQVAKAKTL